VQDGVDIDAQHLYLFRQRSIREGRTGPRARGVHQQRDRLLIVHDPRARSIHSRLGCEIDDEHLMTTPWKIRAK
jgi:hypothetical protein